MAKKGSKGKERPPPVDRLIKPALGIGLALLGYQFFKGIQSEVGVVHDGSSWFRINTSKSNSFFHLF